LMQLAEGDGSSSPTTGLLDLPNGSLPAWKDLPALDLLGLLAAEEVLLERGLHRREELIQCNDRPQSTFDVGDLLCLHSQTGDDDNV